MSQQEVEVDLEGLPPSDEIIDLCEGVLLDVLLQEIRNMQLAPSLAFCCLWIELEKSGTDPEEFFRKKEIIE